MPVSTINAIWQLRPTIGLSAFFSLPPLNDAERSSFSELKDQSVKALSFPGLAATIWPFANHGLTFSCSGGIVVNQPERIHLATAIGPVVMVRAKMMVLIKQPFHCWATEIFH